MKREDVFALLNEEREHQDRKWGTVSEHPHEVGGWLTLIRHYLARAEAAWSTSNSDAEALAEVRKLAALAVACLEQHSPALLLVLCPECNGSGKKWSDGPQVYRFTCGRCKNGYIAEVPA